MLPIGAEGTALKYAVEAIDHEECGHIFQIATNISK